jgi:hypothetical protein
MGLGDAFDEAVQPQAPEVVAHPALGKLVGRQAQQVSNVLPQVAARAPIRLINNDFAGLRALDRRDPCRAGNRQRTSVCKLPELLSLQPVRCSREAVGQKTE